MGSNPTAVRCRKIEKSDASPCTVVYINGITFDRRTQQRNRKKAHAPRAPWCFIDLYVNGIVSDRSTLQRNRKKAPARLP